MSRRRLMNFVLYMFFVCEFPSAYLGYVSIYTGTFENNIFSLFCFEQVRSTIADFAVIISIITFTGIDYAYGINTPKLDVPAEFVTTTGRSELFC